jgi:antitoxin component HigA of HigAB toxin-antitoxin module
LKKIYYWFIGLYYEFLLWLDNFQGSDTNVGTIFGGNSGITNKEVSRAVLEIQKIAYREGVGRIKNKVNTLVAARTGEEYHKVLSEIENLMDFAKETDPKKLELMRILRQAVVFTGDRDIKTSTDKAKAVQKRIEHYQELGEHIQSRTMLRAIRKAHNEGNFELASSLEKAWKEKYGKIYRKRR